MGGALILYAFRATAMEARGVFSPVSREGALLANNILLAVSCFVVFVGTMWPMIAEMFFDRKLSVGPPFFNMAFTPFMVLLGLILPVGAMIPWKRGVISRAFAPLKYVFLLAIALGVLAWSMQTGRSAVGPVGVFLGAWLVFGALVDVWTRTGRGNNRLSRLTRLPRADWGKTTAHAGLGVTMVGIAGLTAWQQEDIRVAQLDETFSVGAYELTLDKVEQVTGPNYISTMGHLTLAKNGSEIAQLRPEKRIYPVAEMPTTEAAIDYRFLRDVYVVIGDAQNNGGWTVRTFIKPLTNWIWLGCLMMAIGGTLSISDRRFRVAAGAQKQRQVAAE
jgi:cytochrome c-type biogenesis protein CcmF